MMQSQNNNLTIALIQTLHQVSGQKFIPVNTKRCQKFHYSNRTSNYTDFTNKWRERIKGQQITNFYEHKELLYIYIYVII